VADNEVEVQLTLDDSGFTDGLDTASKKTKKFADEVVSATKPIDKAFTTLGESLVEGSKKGFGQLVKGVTVANLVTDGIKGVANAVIDFAKGSVNAAIEQENAINQLSQALRASGSFSNQAVQDFSAFASELQRTTLFGDEVILSQIALAKSFGATNEDAKKLVTAAANLSATFGGSLEENLTKLGKTLSGTSGRLGQLIPELKGLTKEQLAAGDAADIINTKFAGAAAAQTETFGGKVTQLSNALSDFQEVLGGLVTQSSAFQGAIGLITGKITELNKSIADNATVSKSLSEGFVESESELNALTNKYADLTLEIEKYQNIVTKAGDTRFLDRESIVLVNNAKAELADLTEQQRILNGVIEASARAVTTAQAAAPKPVGPNKPVLTESEVETKKREQEQILANRIEFNNQLAQIEADGAINIATRKRDALTSDPTLDPATSRSAEIQAVFDAEQEKIKIIRDAEIQKAGQIKDQKNRELAVKVANRKFEINLLKSQLEEEDALKREAKRRDEVLRAQAISNTQNFLQAGILLTKQGSREQQALATANALVNTFQAATNALATPPFIPNGLSAFSLAIATGFSAIRNIQAQRFASGGIVQGTTTRGDQIPARLNAEEMVLTKAQQAVLFNIANGRSSSSNNTSDIVQAIREMPIVVVANGREIARLVRDEKQNGFVI